MPAHTLHGCLRTQPSTSNHRLLTNVPSPTTPRCRSIAKCKRLVEEEDEEFVEEFLSKADPSILHFLIASGEWDSDLN